MLKGHRLACLLQAIFILFKQWSGYFSDRSDWHMDISSRHLQHMAIVNIFHCCLLWFLFEGKVMKVSFLVCSLVVSCKSFCISSLRMWSFCNCNLAKSLIQALITWHLACCKILLSSFLPFNLIQNSHAEAFSYRGTLTISPPSCILLIVPLSLFIQHNLVFVLNNLLVSSPRGLSSLVLF